jgi:hypothetical protein
MRSHYILWLLTLVPEGPKLLISEVIAKVEIKLNLQSPVNEARV